MKYILTICISAMLFCFPHHVSNAQVTEQDALVIYTDDACQLVSIATTTTDLYNHPEVWFPGSSNKQTQLRNYASSAELGVYVRISQRIFVVVTYIVSPNSIDEKEKQPSLLLKE